MACTNQTVRLDGSGSTDADGAVNAFSWNFGDGTSGGGERPTHVFERPGSYTVTLTITGDARGSCGALDTAETTVTVVEAPRIEIVGPDRVAAGAGVDFDAALVGDLDVRGAEFAWDFGDGATAAGPTVEHAFAEPGARTVTLRAVLPGANEGCGTIETRRIVAVNAPPAPVIEVPDRIAAGALVLFDASASTDSDGAITGFAWDFGDGATATGVQAQHRFAAPGTYEVRLAATDDAGVGNSRVETTRTVEVSPPPGRRAADPAAALPGRAARLDRRRGRRRSEGELALRRRGRGRRTEGRPRLRQARRLPGGGDPRRRRRPRQQPPHRGGLRPGQSRAGGRGRTRPHRLPRRPDRLRRRPLGRRGRRPHRLALALQRRRRARRGAGRAQLRRRRDCARSS